MTCLRKTGSFIAGALLAIAALASGFAAAQTLAPARPNVVIVLLDDLGFSDIGHFGGEISTPNIDSLAHGGIAVTNFYVHPRCSPSRAALLTGRHPHEVGMGFLTTPAMAEVKPGPYQGYLAPEAVTLAEALRGRGYRTYMSGKWHLGEHPRHWPRRHGFDRYFGLISGASSYYEIIEDQPMKRRMAVEDAPWTPPPENFYMTEAFTEKAQEYLAAHIENEPETPFFLYLAYTAPHWPLHAPEDAIKPYRGLYDQGPAAVFRQRVQALQNNGLFSSKETLKPPTPEVEGAFSQGVRGNSPAGGAFSQGVRGNSHANKAPVWAERMEIYAAQVAVADRGIGQIVEMLRESGALANTVILLMSDNGASAEDIAGRMLNQADSRIGSRGSYLSYGREWATVSNAPFRGHKGTTFEGGIRSPLILFWPSAAYRRGSIDRQSVVAVTDVMPTIMSLASAPEAKGGEDFSVLFDGKPFNRSIPLFWEHVGWRAMREDNWKVVYIPEQRQWALFDLNGDPAETKDLADVENERLVRMASRWQRWSDQVGTAGFDVGEFMKHYQSR